MILSAALLLEAARVHGRDVLWCVGNTAALSGVVVGKSEERINRHLVAWFWMLACRLRCRIWIEYVDSDSNRADGIIRLYAEDPFAKDHGFTTREKRSALGWMPLTRGGATFGFR